MADTFTQLYVQVVFAVKYRQALILPQWEERLYRYTTGVVQGRGHKMLAIGGMPDHIHLFIGLKPTESISDLVREVKNATNSYINQNQLSTHKFSWQNGYGAFSYNQALVDVVCKYILNQKEHHKNQSFKDEYHGLLDDFGVELGRKETFDFLLPDQTMK